MSFDEKIYQYDSAKAQQGKREASDHRAGPAEPERPCDQVDLQPGRPSPDIVTIEFLAVFLGNQVDAVKGLRNSIC